MLTVGLCRVCYDNIMEGGPTLSETAAGRPQMLLDNALEFSGQKKDFSDRGCVKASGHQG